MGTNRGHGLTRIRVTARRDGSLVSSNLFQQEEVVIGRSPRSDVVLDDALVSWTHALVQGNATSISIIDKSSNGCYRGHERITRADLGSAAVISIPPFEIELRIESLSDVRRQLNTTVAIPARHSPRAAPSQQPAKAFFRIVMGPGPVLGQLFELGSTEQTIGRAEDCDIRLEPRGVSRYHARFIPAGHDRWLIEDSRSENGIEVNGVSTKSAEVSFGDRIGIGSKIVGVIQPVHLADPAVTEPNTTEQSTREALTVSHTRSRLNSGVAIIRVAGRVDSYSYTYLRDQIARIVDEGHAALVVNLADCIYCDHAGLGVLVNLQVTLKPKRGWLCLIGLSNKLHDAFLLLRLDRVLTVAVDEAAAIKLFEGKRR